MSAPKVKIATAHHRGVVVPDHTNLVIEKLTHDAMDQCIWIRIGEIAPDGLVSPPAPDGAWEALMEAACDLLVNGFTP